MNKNTDLDEKKMQQQLDLLIAKRKKISQRAEAIIKEELKKGYSINTAVEVSKRFELKENFKAVKELYDLVKTEKGQSVLGEVLISWRPDGAFNQDNYLNILLGYRALLLTKDWDDVKKALYRVSDDLVADQFMYSVFRIARAEDIGYKHKGKIWLESFVPSEEKIKQDRYAKYEKKYKEQKERNQ